MRGVAHYSEPPFSDGLGVEGESEEWGFGLGGAPGKGEGEAGGEAGLGCAEEPMGGDEARDGSCGGGAGKAGASGDLGEGELAVLAVELDGFEDGEEAD